MKNSMIEMMVALMPYMKPLMWVGVVVATIGLLVVLSNRLFKTEIKSGVSWSIRVALVTAIFFLGAQLAGHFLNMPPTVNFGDSSKFEFILVSFWQIGLGLLVAGLVIKLLASKNDQGEISA